MNNYEDNVILTNQTIFFSGGLYLEPEELCKFDELDWNIVFLPKFLQRKKTLSGSRYDLYRAYLKINKRFKHLTYINH